MLKVPPRAGAITGAPNMNCGITPMQGRVMFHNERLCRSAGGSGPKCHARFIELAAEADLRVMIDTWSDDECRLGLTLLERAARDVGMNKFRDVRCS